MADYEELREAVRQEVLDAFGVTQEDLDALDAVDGYRAARAEATATYHRFEQHLFGGLTPGAVSTTVDDHAAQ